MRYSMFKFFCITLCLLLSASFASELTKGVKLKFGGAGWVKSGQIRKSSNKLASGGESTNGNSLNSMGALFNSSVDFQDGWTAAFGIGVGEGHSIVVSKKELRPKASSFLSQAWMGYQTSQDAKPFLKVQAGFFPYKYDHNIKNFGLYLIRGSLYPVIIESGFETREMLPSGNVIGFHIENNIGSYNHHLILKSEESKPKFDYSLLYIGNYDFNEYFSLGGGVNFHRFIPNQKEATIPTEEDFPITDSSAYTIEVNGEDTVKTLNVSNHQFAVPNNIDEENNQATSFEWISLQGIKVMGRFVLDPKFGTLPFLAKQDLKIYGEVAVLGIKNYSSVYQKLENRMPVMVGINLPFGNWVDQISVELEWFDSPYEATNLNTGGKLQTVPTFPEYSPKRDNIKWSVYGAKVFAKHIKISGQIASDHLRATSGGRELFTTPSDWYWMTKLSYFF